MGRCLLKHTDKLHSVLFKRKSITDVVVKYHGDEIYRSDYIDLAFLDFIKNANLGYEVEYEPRTPRDVPISRIAGVPVTMRYDERDIAIIMYAKGSDEYVALKKLISDELKATADAICKFDEVLRIRCKISSKKKRSR